MKKSWVVFCVLFSVLSVSCEKTIRSFPNGTETTCLGIVCPKNFIFEPCTLGDGKNDKCVSCPPDRPISVAKFDSSSFYEPPDNVCKDPHEICICADEAKLMNPEECLNNINPECQCDVSRGYIGSDPKLCKLSENSCSFPGFELALNAHSSPYKVCCVLPYIVDQPGDSKTKRTCKLQPTVNTPFPGKKTSVPNSVPTTDKGYASIPTSSATVNVSDASTYSPPGNETIGNPRHLTHIELLDIERPNSSGKGWQKKSTETDGLLQDTTQNISETGDKDDSYIVDDFTDQLNTIRNSDHDVSQTRQTSESGKTVDNVLDSCEEFNSTGQLSQSPDNIATHENRRNSVDTELKKKISSENTNVKEREQESTSNVPILHVDSMLSGENASPTVSSYIYRLFCRSSGEDRLSRGSIECCDGQQHCLKSRVLSEFVTGKVLLSVPFTMAHMTTFVVFVPDNEHDGAKPYIDIQMEQLSNSLEIQSLLEPDSIILHLESFETINLQRPEENLEHWVHSISVQPHQMPVPHEQKSSR
ncbi:unnamed protein product [Mytilus coruscus]|uniref:TNFR-Cys domain-containing protein n=1 Tax=Mytilus coruscus TaxID=42192 RepID=A0A6J8BZ64_MYTCO|nr:unnamed protein product [Mytilus coruscus]